MWRVAKVVSRRPAKALHLDWKPAQHFSLRLKTIKHASFQSLLYIRQLNGHSRPAIVWQEF
jgi:hypothetical protein